MLIWQSTQRLIKGHICLEDTISLHVSFILEIHRGIVSHCQNEMIGSKDQCRGGKEEENEMAWDQG